MIIQNPGNSFEKTIFVYVDEYGDEIQFTGNEVIADISEYSHLLAWASENDEDEYASRLSSAEELRDQAKVVFNTQ